MRKTPLGTTSLLLLLIALATFPVASMSQEANALVVGAGLYDTAAWADSNGDYDSIEAGLEYRWSYHLPFGVQPMVGASLTDQSAFWLYAGGRRPWNLGEKWSAALSFGAAYYEQGDGKNLGHELEFRSGIDFQYRLASGDSIGLEYYHLSNASISDVNPGSNSLRLTCSFRLGK